MDTDTRRDMSDTDNAGASEELTPPEAEWLLGWIDVDHHDRLPLARKLVAIADKGDGSAPDEAYWDVVETPASIPSKIRAGGADSRRTDVPDNIGDLLVRALHGKSPIQIYDGEGEEEATISVCRHCDELASRGAGDQYESVLWPCATLQALGVAV
jgi:hypothetical protein